MRLKAFAAALLLAIACLFPVLDSAVPGVASGVAWGGEQEDTEREVREAIEALRARQQPASPDALEAMAKGILEKMAEVRGLPTKGPVEMEVATREQIVSYVDSRIKEEMKEEALAGQEIALKRLGLIPDSMDLRSFLLDLYGEQVAGYYDPFKSKFYIASWMQPAQQGPIMAHELTHALQDQHFNLKPFLTPLPEDSDATGARQAVVEGDAVLAMMSYMLGGAEIPAGTRLGPTLRRQMVSPMYPVFQNAPPYMQESLFFPYADGADFVAAVYEKGGWKAVTALYEDLPTSTEQVLHPEKYLETRDPPTAVAMKMSLDGYREVHTDVLGELVVRVMLAGLLEAGVANEAAAGWDGDRYRAFHPKKGGLSAGKTVIVHRSTWDTADDAKEFAAAYESLVPRKYERASRKAASRKGGTPYFSTAGDGFVRVERRERDVVLVDGAPDLATAEKAAALAWRAK